jgi:signal transduction histidine kinase
VIDRQVQHLVRMVDDLLDVSTRAARQGGAAREPIDIADAIAIAAETSRPLIDAQKQAAAAGPAEPAGDGARRPVRLSQVIANLLNNASKYSEPARPSI